jgi:hypothetical protein
MVKISTLISKPWNPRTRTIGSSTQAWKPSNYIVNHPLMTLSYIQPNGPDLLLLQALPQLQLVGSVGGFVMTAIRHAVHDQS